MTPRTDAPEGPSLRRLADAAEARLGEHGLALRDLGVLGPEDPAASHFVAAVERGLKAGAVVRAAAEVVGGGGGGRDTMAQAGGRDPEKLADALATARAEIERALQS